MLKYKPGIYSEFLEGLLSLSLLSLEIFTIFHTMAEYVKMIIPRGAKYIATTEKIVYSFSSRASEMKATHW